MDVRTRAARKEIVDGQQRSTAIHDFYHSRLRLSRSLELAEAAGRTYDELPEELQAKFLSYGLSVDLYLSASPDEVRESFRRINSYTVPLNPEEQRHARFQGPFKWFIHRLSRDFDQVLIEMGVFGQKQIVRMADAKLWTEFCDACLNGVKTTSKLSLNRLYTSRTQDFPEENELSARIREAMEFLIDMPELDGTELVKPYQFYSLLLATSHYQRAIPTMVDILPVRGVADFDRIAAITALTALADAAEHQEVDGPLGSYVRASLNKTNVREQRMTRISCLYTAINGTLTV